jgi:putative Holliday junction resolvase
MRILALDIGDVRIGIAVSDPMGIIANPLETYNRCGIKKDILYISDLIKQKDAKKLVAGLPISMNGGDNPQVVKTREFCDALKESTDIDIVFFDERFSTQTAKNALIEADMSRENRKKVIDKVAATVILQNYLNCKRF